LVEGFDRADLNATEPACPWAVSTGEEKGSLMQCGLFYQLPCAPGQDAVTRYQETMEQIVYAEELGFDIAWLAELHFYRPFSILSSPLILAAALAQRTRRIRLGTAVVLLPLQHPLRVAEDAATVDLLSQGRLELGVGRGAIAIHFQGFNVPVEESRGRFEEALAIIQQAWTQETCAFAGKYFQVPETAVVPKPLQHPHPPLRIAANSPETAAFAGACGYPVFVASVINPFPKLPVQIDLYRRAFGAAGHTGRRADVAAMFPVYVADSAAHVRHEVEASVMYYFRTVVEQLRLGERDASPSYAYLREVRQRMEAITWEEADATMALYGSPEQCVRKLREAHARCGMDQVICWFNPGGLVPHRQVLASMRRFAEEVMPAVRGL
jgi:alkanesulfonate monooxygenase SsuD/methylene tetrahydromethanopterin reductase-like flavin-dependent oxidoreductase (luciferase family)